MKALGVALALVALALPRTALAQSVTAEADVTVGRSSDDVNAAAAQVRLFGASKTDWRFFAEAAWGRGGVGSDAFGSAYPYDHKVHAMEGYVEKTFTSTGRLVGVRLGRFRTPFGISGRSDHAYTGFTRAPLIRYGQNWAISNSFMEAGVDVLAGRPQLYAEASIGAPTDEGDMHRRQGADVVARGQGYYRLFIAGASFLRTQPSRELDFAFGRMMFRGVDVRWMNRGVQIRGEWIDGRPFDMVATRGGYLDAIVHHRQMGPVTAVARIERLDYVAGEFSEYLRRCAAGARIRLARDLELQVNVIHQLSATGMLVGLALGARTALDAGLTYSVRY